jgi:pyridoxamine 5'-phosphate oxidase
VENNNTATDPIKLFFNWYAEAQGKSGEQFQDRRAISMGIRLMRRLLNLILPGSNLLRPDIATLATTTADNKPAARSVLFKGFVHGGFSFYTDYQSNKGRELKADPSAVLVFYWHFPPRQVRIDGTVKKLTRKEAEADWDVRRRDNQTASAAFTQSSIIQGREELKEKVKQIKRQYRGRPVPCPDSWGGYCLIPERMEFWEGRLNWLHNRVRYVLKHGKWQKQFLAP